MSDASGSTNPFARVLMFYYLYLRAKITSTDFEKIAKKYAGKGDKLLVDLQAKYTFPIPEQVWLIELSRLCTIFSIPASYLRLMNVADPYFDPRTDAYSSEFNAEHALFSGILSVSYRNAPPKDNIYAQQIRQILPGYTGTVVKEVPRPAGLKSSSSASSLQSEANSEKPKSRHLFELIAEDAQKHKNDRHCKDPSPLALIGQFMRDRVRVRIVLRRHNRYLHTACA